MNRKKKGNGGASAKDAAPSEKLKGKAYAKQLSKLHVELVRLQEWVKYKGLKICIVFEGRDGAGKGGTIKAITERASTRVFRVVALPAPTEREKSQMYIQRYLPHLPAAGEIVFFDRSWYNRAGVERVMGFCSEDEVANFLRDAPDFEELVVRDGVKLFKFYLSLGREMQLKRFHERRHDPFKRWKLSPIDIAAIEKSADY